MAVKSDLSGHIDTLKIRTLLNNNKLVLVSNREPYSHERLHEKVVCRKNTGGVVSAIDPIMQICKGLWIAWGSGNADRMLSDSKDRVKVPPSNPSYTIKRVWFSKKDVADFYRGFCNRVLWPIAHLFPEKTKYIEKYWKAYERVNKKFLNAVIEEARVKDLIWVHDYHLALLPSLIRNIRNNAKIAFFWHIPWPPHEVFAQIPWQREILEGMLGSDFIVFHTPSYAENFMECVKNELNLEVNKNTIKLDGRKVVVKALPLGIDYDQFADGASSKEIKMRARSLRRKLRAKYLVFSIDRLDYTKGIVNKAKAFKRLLEKYPELKRKVVYLQVASPSRKDVEEYKQIKREVDEISGQVNGAFGTLDWVPMRYFYRRISHKQLLTRYSATDIALITPLVDGMNLVAKEYVASSDENGVLILSELAGAAKRLNKAIIVNPHDIEGIADAIKHALDMSEDEKRKRLEALKKKVKRHDVFWWVNTFFDEWSKVYG